MEDKRNIREAALARRNALPADERAQRSRALCDALMAECEALHPPLGSLIAAYAPLGSEPDVWPFVQKAVEHGWRVCFPCMLRTAETQSSGGRSRMEMYRLPGGELCEADGTCDGATSALPKSTTRPFGTAVRKNLAGRWAAAGIAQAAAGEALDNSMAKLGNRPIARKNGVSPSGSEDAALHADRPARAFLTHPARAVAPGDPCLQGCTKVSPEQIDIVLVPLVAFDDDGNRLGYGGGNYDRLLAELRAGALVLGVAFEEQRVAHVPTEPHDQPLPRIIVG